MFDALEKSLKSQMERMERNMGHMLERLEEAEKKLIPTKAPLENWRKKLKL